MENESGKLIGVILPENVMKPLESHFNRLLTFERTGVFRVGQVEYTKESDNIVFYKSDDSNEERYDIPLSKLQTAEQQLLWLYHITGKGFLTEKVLGEFLQCLEMLCLKPPGHV